MPQLDKFILCHRHSEQPETGGSLERDMMIYASVIIYLLMNKIDKGGVLLKMTKHNKHKVLKSLLDFLTSDQTFPFLVPILHQN